MVAKYHFEPRDDDAQFAPFKEASIKTSNLAELYVVPDHYNSKGAIDSVEFASKLPGNVSFSWGKRDIAELIEFLQQVQVRMGEED